MTKKENTKKNINKKVSTKSLNVQKKSEYIAEATNELKKLLMLIVSVVAILCVFYIATLIVTNKNKMLKYSKDEVASQISYTDILASNILEKDGSYYVLIEDSDDPYIDLYKTYISSYTGKEDNLSVYLVDLNDSLNQKYKADENDFSNENLKFKSTVLLKIVDRKVESYYQDSTSINEHLKSLVMN